MNWEKISKYILPFCLGVVQNVNAIPKKKGASGGTQALHLLQHCWKEIIHYSNETLNFIGKKLNWQVQQVFKPMIFWGRPKTNPAGGQSNAINTGLA